MKIKELLELTQNERLEDIARDRLTIGKGPVRDALKAAGCFPRNGKRGWFYEGDPARLEQSIYDFAGANKERKTRTERNNEKINQQIKEPILKPTLESSNIEKIEVARKRASYDLDVALQKRLKLYCVQHDKNLYEVVEAALRDYLEKQE